MIYSNKCQSVKAIHKPGFLNSIKRAVCRRENLLMGHWTIAIRLYQENILY